MVELVRKHSKNTTSKSEDVSPKEPIKTHIEEMRSPIGSSAISRKNPLDKFRDKNGVIEDIEEKVMSSVKGIILSKDEFDKFREQYGFIRGHRGTFWNAEREVFLYIKTCLRVETKEQAVNSLAVVEFLTKKGIVFPGTKWGVFHAGPDESHPNRQYYQLFAVTRKLEEASIALHDGSLEGKKGIQEILTWSKVSSEVGHHISENEWYSALLNRKDSHILEWYRRIEPEFNPNAPLANKLTRLLNFGEASHADNWAWDLKTGKLYPVDMEVISLNSRDGSHEKIVNDWCSVDRK